VTIASLSDAVITAGTALITAGMLVLKRKPLAWWHFWVLGHGLEFNFYLFIIVLTFFFTGVVFVSEMRHCAGIVM